MFIIESASVPETGSGMLLGSPVVVTNAGALSRAHEASKKAKNAWLSGVDGGHGVWATVPVILGAVEVGDGVAVALAAFEAAFEACVGHFDAGCAKVVFVLSPASSGVAFAAALATSQLPLDRIAVRLPMEAATPIFLQSLPPNIHAVILNIPFIATPRQLINDAVIAAHVASLKPLNAGLVLAFGTTPITIDDIAALAKEKAHVMLPAAVFGFNSTASEQPPPYTLDMGRAFAACLNTDRPDGLFATVIVDEYKVALGLAYSSVESIAETFKTGQGVYQSRSRGGLWVKGLTSGATQRVFRVDADCDRDAIQFVVHQADPGFCHLNTRTCFGADTGLTALEATLRSRKANAPAGSYTSRLFNDATLLHAKIVEEAQELCDATDKEEIAWEAADLIYFALVKAVAHGVSLADIEAHLEKRAAKVTRRRGDAKPGAIKPAVATPATAPTTGPHAAPTPVAVTAKLPIQLKVHNDSSLDEGTLKNLLHRPILNLADISARVGPIVADVKQRGDAALVDFTAKFDKVNLTHGTVLRAPFPRALIAEVQPTVAAAIDVAFANIATFHRAQAASGTLSVETMPGVVCSRFSRPIDRVGLYVPGGTAILPSTTMMLGVPAMVAGCREIVVASPPRKDGTPVPEVVYVADKIGASAIVLAGGAQAVAAMAYGTESVPKVDKIVGPGNQYVTAAKMQLQNDTEAMISIDMPAGPSELLVIADNNSNPAYVVSDLLSQAEHGIDSQVILVAIAPTPQFLASIQTELSAQGEALPRSDIVRVSISKSYILAVDTRERALAFSNQYAPEHLILHIDEPESVLKDITNAGSVFVGPWSPESCGDYASGTNHTLPTYGYARMYSGVNTDTFLKHITAQTLTRDGLDLLGDTVTTLAEIEGLEAHRNAVAIRLRDIRAGKADNAKVK